MAAQRNLDALKEEMLVKINDVAEECKLNIENVNEEAKQFAKSLHEIQVQELNGLELNVNKNIMDLELKLEQAIQKKYEALEEKIDKVSNLILNLQLSLSVPPAVSPVVSPLGGPNDFVNSALWLKIIGTTPNINGVWYTIPEIITKSGKVYKGPKKLNLLPEESFSNADQKDRDKIVTPVMESNCFWNAADYLKFLPMLISYNNHGGKKSPNSWNGASWDRFCTNIDIKDPLWRAQITLKQLILVIIYNFWSGDSVVEILLKLKGIKLNWFGPQNCLTNFRAWREKLEDLLPHLSYSANNLISYIEPNIIDNELYFSTLKATLQVKSAEWTSWEEMFAEVEEFCSKYDQIAKSNLAPFAGYKHPGKAGDPKKVANDPKIVANDQKINANKELFPKAGFKCRICDKKYANKKKEDLADDEQNHGYPFAIDGSGPCKCPNGSANPEGVKAQLKFLRENYALKNQNQKK